MPTDKAEFQPFGTSSGPDLQLPDKEATGTHNEKRACARLSVESCRSIAIRRLDNDRNPSGRWFLADIVDVGKGGMCLIAPDEQSLEIGQWILIDLRAQPGFGQLRMQAQVRWLTRGHFALTFGIAFGTALSEIPLLSTERRSMRRDPNEEDWALQEEMELATTRGESSRIVPDVEPTPRSGD